MKKNKILFLLSHQPHPRFIKQIRYLSANNHISVIYFSRNNIKDLKEEYIKDVVFDYDVGKISDGNYIKRIFNYMISFKKIYKHFNKECYDVVIVNNIDTMFLFLLSNIFKKNKGKLFVEISDLRSHAYDDSLKSKVIRYVEKKLFSYVDGLIVTSPKFYDVYYSEFFKKDYFVLENKPLSSMLPRKSEKVKSKKLVIGIVGMLAQGGPYKTLFEVVKNNINFEVHIYGKGQYQNMVEEYASKYENIKYFGEYNFFKDSAKIYASLDILYMPYDTTNGSLNNKVALPNKLYEAMYFNVPIITSKDTYLGDIVTTHDIGILVKCCDEIELMDILNNLNLTNYLSNFSLINEEKYLADNDYVELERFILSDERYDKNE